MGKEIILQRKQPMDYEVNYPQDGRLKNYSWIGTRGNKITERPVPEEVFEWLVQNTNAIKNGSLVVKPGQIEEDEDLKYTLENISDIDKVEGSIFTVNEIKEILEKGNHLTLKKKLNEITKDKPEELIKNIKRQFTTIASDLGVDSSAKRKVLCEWSGLDSEISDTMFDNEV